MKVSDYIVSYLESIGVKNCYYLPGGAIMHLIESLRKSNLNLIQMLNEEDCTIASEADNIYANKLNSVVIVTAGPGVLNAVNAIASAYIDSVPMLIIGGQCKTEDSMAESRLRQMGVQEVDNINVVNPITKYSNSINDVNYIKYELEKAIYLINNDRKGTGFLEIPQDIQGMEFDEKDLKNNTPYILENYNIEYDTNIKIDYLLELLNKSIKPVILAGNGIRQSGALEQFKELIENVRIPILLTWKSKDFLSENNSLDFGMPGSIASKYANHILQECDLLISIGARIDLPTCAYDYKNFAKNAKKVIVDIDRAEIDKLQFEKELIFNCDTKIFIEKFNKAISPKITIDYKNVYSSLFTHLDWWSECNNLKIDNPILTHKSELIDPYTFVEELSKYTKEDDIIVASSSGSASEIMAQAYRIKGTQRYISSNGLGSMGYAVSAAVGACISSGKRVICVEGDGSFAMNFKSIHLIKKYNLPIKIFIWNNNGYNSIKNTQNKFFGNYINCDTESGLTFPKISKIAYAYNIPYFKIENHNVLFDCLEEVLLANSPYIVEVMIDPEIQTQPKVMSFTNKKGEIESGKLEKMWPFIEKKND